MNKTSEAKLMLFVSDAGATPGDDTNASLSSLADPSFAMLPAWFSAGQAAAVLKKLNRTFAVFQQSDRRLAIASREALTAAPPQRQALAYASTTTSPSPAPSPSDICLAADSSHEAALATMNRLKVDRLLVQQGALTIGVLTRAAVEAARVPMVSFQVRRAYTQSMAA
jgi:hypothetical protein